LFRISKARAKLIEETLTCTMIRNLQFETSGRIEMIGDVSVKNTWALIKEFGVKRLLIDVY
jgi:hypothetical protein